MVVEVGAVEGKLHSLLSIEMINPRGKVLSEVVVVVKWLKW